MKQAAVDGQWAGLTQGHVTGQELGGPAPRHAWPSPRAGTQGRKRWVGNRQNLFAKGVAVSIRETREYFQSEAGEGACGREMTADGLETAP